MNQYRARKTRRLLLIVLAAALAVPAPAAASGGAGGRVADNDVAHFGRTASPEPSNPNLGNDRVHFGDTPVAAAPVVVRVGGGFDWASAGVGAAGMLGLALVTGVGVSAMRRRNHLGAASA